MDFSEQSITLQRNDDDDMNEYIEDGPLSSIQRGHWSRMSLPPRLSYLEGYLDRARHMSSRTNEGDDGTHKLGQYKEDEAANDDTLSMEGSVDHDRTSQDDPDTLNFSPVDGSCDTEQASPFVEEKPCVRNNVDVTFSVDSTLDKDREENHERTDGDFTKEETVISEQDVCSENFILLKHEQVSYQGEDDICESESNQLSAEATIILSPEGGICEIDNTDSNL